MDFNLYTVQKGEGIFLHCNRMRGDMFKYDNQDIDISRSHLNSRRKRLPMSHNEVKYLLPDDYYPVVNGYLEKSKKITGKAVSKRARCVVGIVLTMPRQYLPPEGTDYNEWYTEERIRKENGFYSKALQFLLNKFGYYDQTLGPNFLCVSEHRDETSSHCHILFIPVVKTTYEYNKKYTKKGKTEYRKIVVRQGTISAWNVVTRSILKVIHQELDSFLKKEVDWYKGGILLSPEERMMPDQNLRLSDLKKAGKGYAEKRAKVNRLAFIAEETSLNEKALVALKDEGHQASLIKLVDKLIKDGKLTEEDCKKDPIYHEAYIFYDEFKKKRKEIAKANVMSLRASDKSRTI